MIEQAIRASIQELQTAGKDGDDADALQRAIQASVAEAARARKLKTVATQEPPSDDHDRELADALHRSLTQEERHPFADADFDDSGVDTEDDDNIKTAIQQSRVNETSDKDLKQAIKLSREDHEERSGALNKIKTEEEIVLDYVKRQSLLEDHFQKNNVDSWQRWEARQFLSELGP